ncbi:MAG TPA: class I SAM-dependent methyltransferase [Candidatus Eisenbacteria bacterium]
MGRWRRPPAERFVRWLDTRPGLDWLDVGCGTGALASALCALSSPASVVARDPSKPFVEHPRRRRSDPRVSAVVAGAEDLPRRPGASTASCPAWCSASWPIPAGRGGAGRDISAASMGASRARRGTA